MTDDGVGLVVFPQRGEAGGSQLGASLRACAERYLCRLGSILFRGFEVDGEDALWRFAGGFGPPPCREPGRRWSEGHARPEPQHLASASGGWPSRLWFHAASSAGGLRLVDGREVFRQVPGKLRARFVDRGLQYVRDFERPALGAAGEAQRQALAESCRTLGMLCERRQDGGLRTRQLVPAVIAHPVTGQLVWFNRAHLFHERRARRVGSGAVQGVVCAEPEVQERVSYGDGSPIDAGALAELWAVFERLEQRHSWQAGDVLLLDNLSIAHTELRAPERGGRSSAPASSCSMLCSVDALGADLLGLGTPPTAARLRGVVSSSERSVSTPSRACAQALDR